MNKDQKLRDDMMALYGALASICFPIHWINDTQSQPYYDLIDNILAQYKSILKRLWDIKDE